MINVIYPNDNWILNKMGNVLCKTNNYNPVIYDIRTRSKELYENSSILFSSNKHINFYINYALMKKKTNGVDVCLFTHIPDNDKDFFEKSKLADFRICMSRKYKEILKNNGFSSIYIIPGVDEIFKPKLILGFVGRLKNKEYSKRKGHDLLNEISKLDFVDLKMTNTNLKTEELPNFYNSIDYVLVTSRVEGGPMCIIEGISCGKKIISPLDIGFAEDFSEYIIPFENGNLNSLTCVLNKLFEEKKRMNQFIIDNYSWNCWCKKIKIFFEDILK